MSVGKTGECVLSCDPTQCSLRSRMDGPLDGTGTWRADAVRPSIQSEVRVPLDELDAYHVEGPATVCFSVWEFRAAILAAESLNSLLHMEFREGGQPLFFHMDTDALRGEFILATTGTPSAAAPPTRKRAAPTRAEPVRRPRGTPPARAPVHAPTPASPAPPDEPAPVVNPESDDDLLPMARPVKQELSTLPERQSPAPSRQPKPPPSSETAPSTPLRMDARDFIAPTPAEDNGDHDEHPSTLFDDTTLSPPWPSDHDDEDLATMPPTQVPPSSRPPVRTGAQPTDAQFTPLFL